MHEIGLGLIESLARLLQRGLDLANLLIEFGRRDLGERLARLHSIADIDHAACEITIGAGENRGFGDRLDISGEIEFGRARRAADRDHVDARQGVGVKRGFGADQGVAGLQRDVAGEESRHNNHDGDDGDSPDHEAGWTPRRMLRSLLPVFFELPPQFFVFFS